LLTGNSAESRIALSATHSFSVGKRQSKTSISYRLVIAYVYEPLGLQSLSSSVAGMVIPTYENGPALQALGGVCPDAVENCGKTSPAKLLVNDKPVKTTVWSWEFGSIEHGIKVILGRFL
jgi:hypothetical protein